MVVLVKEGGSVDEGHSGNGERGANKFKMCV